MINTGTIDEVGIQIRNITEFAIQQKCNRIIVSHNHPHGLHSISDDDIAFTYTMLCSCLLNDIDIVDHVIVGTDNTISMNDNGLLSSLKTKALKNIRISDAQRNDIIESTRNFIVSSPTKDYFSIT